MATEVRVVPGRVGIVLTKEAARKLSARKAGGTIKAKSLLMRMDAKGKVME